MNETDHALAKILSTGFDIVIWYFVGEAILGVLIVIVAIWIYWKFIR